MACMFCSVLFALENCRDIDSARFRLKLNRPTNRWIPDRFPAAPEDDVHASPFGIALPISSAVSNRWDQPRRNPSRVERAAHQVSSWATCLTAAPSFYRARCKVKSASPTRGLLIHAGHRSESVVYVRTTQQVQEYGLEHTEEQER
jgi:hypothetical protein